MDGILGGLNARQREAVEATEGYVRVIAGAGTGKTRALTHRYAYLTGVIGVPPRNILCVTFTNKAAGEMRRRIRSLLGDGDTGYIDTFHSFCVSVLQEDSHALGYPKSFLVIDNSDIDAMLAIVYEERGLTLRDMTFTRARDMIELRKTDKQPDYCLLLLDMSAEELHARYLEATDPQDIIFYGYLYQEKKCFALDYNDLIIFTLYMFEQNEAIRRKWQERLEYIMIDEFQDIDALQYRLMEALAAHHRNLFVVGDPDQTIYSWRGADVKFLLNFENAFPGCRTIVLSENYRSTPEIIAVANSLISANRDRIEKELCATLPSGRRVYYSHEKTAEREAEWIAKTIEGLAAEGAAYSEVAILYRAHYVSRELEEAFLKHDLPYTIYSGTPFFSRREVKDALCYLRLVALRDDISFRRVANVPRRNIGKSRMQFLEEYAAENGCTLYEALVRNADGERFRGTGAAKLIALVERFSRDCADRPISELLGDILDASGYERALRTEGSQTRLDNLAELRQSIHEYEISCGEESTLENYLDHAALFTASDAGSERNVVRMMTVHTAKGLEFPYVFVCSLDEGVFPSKKTSTPAAMEEERRLAFVAITRAERALFLSDSEGRNLDGSFRCPSRFIFDVERTLLDYRVELSDSLRASAEQQISAQTRRMQLSATAPRFSVGERILHPVMGAGTVTGIDEDSSLYYIKFDTLATARRISWNIKLEPGGIKSEDQ